MINDISNSIMVMITLPLLIPIFFLIAIAYLLSIQNKMQKQIIKQNNEMIRLMIKQDQYTKK